MYIDYGLMTAVRVRDSIKRQTQKMATTAISFRWLDILEKEFDKAFVDLDILIGDVDNEEPDLVYNARQKISTLSSCFAQLTHKAQTIFQNSAKVEAELVHLRAELIDAQARHGTLEQELHTVLLRLHAQQLRQLSVQDHNSEHIRQRLEGELHKSPAHQPRNKSETAVMQSGLAENAALSSEVWHLRQENSALRNTLLALHSEVSGAKLAAKYLDKELAGRIQQLQLLGREMRGDVRDKLWRQLESEILLHRHKTIVRACRGRGVAAHRAALATPAATAAAAAAANTIGGGEDNANAAQGLGEPRVVTLQLTEGEGLGLSITGGRENGVPILISELEPAGPAARSAALYVGDAVLAVNGRDLRQACHREAAQLLSAQAGAVRLTVQYVASEDSDDESLGEDIYAYRYRFYDDEVLGSSPGVALHPLTGGGYPCGETRNGLATTPTAPRTPESPRPITRTTSDCSYPDSPLHPDGPAAGRASLSQSEANMSQCSEANYANHNSLSQSEANMSQYSDANYAHSIALGSPMQVSTDESVHVTNGVERQLSNSEESLMRNSPAWGGGGGVRAARKTHNHRFGPEKSPPPSVPPSERYDDSSATSSPMKSGGNINDISYESVEEGKVGRRFVISTLQQIFGVGRTETSRAESKDSQEGEVLLEPATKVSEGDEVASPESAALLGDLDAKETTEVDFKNNVSETGRVSEPAPIATTSGAVEANAPEVAATANGDDNVGTDSPREKKRHVKYTSGGGLSTKPRRKISVKGTQFAVKLSEKRSGRAQRMKADESSTGSSFDDDVAKERLRESLAKGHVSFPNTKLRVLRSELNCEVGGPNFVTNYKDRVRDSLGDPDFGTPV